MWYLSSRTIDLGTYIPCIAGTTGDLVAKLCPTLAVVALHSGETNSLRRTMHADSGVQFITPARPRHSLLLAKVPNQFL